MYVWENLSTHPLLCPLEVGGLVFVHVSKFAMGSASSIVEVDTFYSPVPGVVLGSLNFNNKKKVTISPTKMQECLDNVVNSHISKLNNRSRATTALSQDENDIDNLNKSPDIDIEVVEERFSDSIYIKSFLSQVEADNLYQVLSVIGEKNRPKNTKEASKAKPKYPLWSKYYGIKRKLDGARALDRWGSYHESWTRVEEPPEELHEISTKLRKYFNASDDSVNSIVVNYYYDGENTYIPAHRDSMSCLEDHSKVICLSLGAARDFILCANEDAGKYIKNDMKIKKEWRVKQGDLFCIGKQTNLDYCHAVPQEVSLKSMRISVIFRSIDKSFINQDSYEKVAHYHDGREKVFHSECITTKSYNDVGHKEHLADLITKRENERKILIEKNEIPSNNCDRNSLVLTDYDKERLMIDAKKVESYYMGEGVTTCFQPSPSILTAVDGNGAFATLRRDVDNDASAFLR
eukprot:gene6482-8915_t